MATMGPTVRGGLSAASLLSCKWYECFNAPASKEEDCRMRLTLHTDYALRVLMYVGVKGETLSTIPEIVEQFDISKGHVMKVVHHLARKGYLQTSRGKRGGMRLARKPDQIVVGTVVRD